MPVSLIAAVATNLVIGDKGRLPWRLRDDMARFRSITMGHPVVMGRRTWESLEKPLAGRRNIVISRSPDFTPGGCDVARSREEALALAGSGEIFVIGGASVYELFLPIADRLYITHVDVDVDGDSYFPPVQWEEWRLVTETRAEGEPGSPPHRFADYVRRHG